MAQTPGRKILPGQNMLARLSAALFKIFTALFSLVVVGLVLNIISGIITNYVPKNITELLRAPTEWIFNNPLVFLLLLVIFLLLMLIFHLLSRAQTSSAPVEQQNTASNPAPVTPSMQPPLEAPSQPSSEKDLERRYLHAITIETEYLTLRGIPAGLISESVRLDEIFIPLELRPNRPRSDYPLTEKEIETYRQLALCGASTREQDRAVMEAECNWFHTLLKQSDRISIGAFWQALTSDDPAAVIQGYPGMGKSTLMERLALHMARRALHRHDLSMPEPESFAVTLIPLLVRLGRYAGALKQTPDLTLPAYLTQLLAEMQLSGCDAFIEQSLRSGSCLVIFDGLDEVSDPKRREQVQDEIRAFVKKYRTLNKRTFNRFLITSRVAGFDQHAFPDYPHSIIAELSKGQIDAFIPRWCSANVQRARNVSGSSIEQDSALQQEIKRHEQELRAALSENESVRELAENPLLLTLLAMMQQNSIELPRRRVELYDTVTYTLLENRNTAKKLDTVLVVQAIKYLGPLAFQMQDTNNSLARQHDVMEALTKAIDPDRLSPERTQEEAEAFLNRIRARGGLFVLRSGDYFGFMHRTFQEYFAARYVLNQIKTNQKDWIDQLVKRAQRQDAFWREPFLLAVAYQSGTDEKIANEIIRALLLHCQKAPPEEQLRDLLLACDCLTEAKPSTIENELEKQIAGLLLQEYETAQKAREFDTCKMIEHAVSRRLRALHKEDRHAPFLAPLAAWICDRNQPAQQKAALTLLIMIAQQIQSCSATVFDRLVPLLLAQAGLSAIGRFQPADRVPVSSNFDVADLSLAALSFMGRPGPAGQLLEEIRTHFKDHPEQLRQLARYSLLKTLLSPPLNLLGWR